MNFNTSSFALFMLVVSSLYLAFQWSGRLRAQNCMLLIASYAFYGNWDHRFLFLLMLSTAADYFCGLAIAHKDPTRRSVVVLALYLTTGCVALCAPINWDAILAAVRPEYAYSGGWGDRLGFRSNFLEGPLSPLLGASLACLIFAFFYTLGYRLQGNVRRRYYLFLSVSVNLILLGFFNSTVSRGSDHLNCFP